MKTATEGTEFLAAAVPDLTALLYPESVAIIGGVSKATGLGNRTLRHLREAGYRGTIVTPGPGETLTDDVDVAVIGVPAAAAPAVLDSIDGRAKYAVVYSSGFEEIGAAGLRTSRGTIVIGPNTVGLYHAPSRATLTFAQAFDSLVDCRHGSGAFLVSQSGAFGARVVSAASRYGFHLDGFIGSGNEAELDACTLARGVLAATRPRVLMLYLEGLRDGASLEALLADARDGGVHIVCLLGGLSDAGATAAASHTAAVSTDTAVIEELFGAYGATLVGSDRDLIMSSLAFSLLGSARGRRVGIVTGSGGAGVVASDLLSDAGLTIPALTGPTRTLLAGHLPAIASTTNPVDVTAQIIGDDAILNTVCDALRDSGEVDAVLVIAREHQAVTAGAVSGARIPTVLATLDREPADVRPLIETGHVVMPDLETACRMVAALTRHCGAPQAVPRMPRPQAPWRRLTTEPTAAESLGLVADEGVDTAAWQLAHSAGQVVEIGDDLGWPVVLKTDTAAGVHKARAGGVKLDVDRATAVAAAGDLFGAGADAVIVAKQLRTSLELFVGVRRDARWGAVVSAGLGGANVELLNQTVAMPAFLGADHLAARLDDMIFSRVADRYTGVAAALAQAAGRLAQLTDSSGAALVECNPMGWIDGRLVALDARVVL